MQKLLLTIALFIISISSVLAQNNYTTLPDGTILEWDYVSVAPNSNTFFDLPYPFPHAGRAIFASIYNLGVTGSANAQFAPGTGNQYIVRNNNPQTIQVYVYIIGY